MVERQTLSALLVGAWPRRAVAALRLERFACDESRAMLEDLVSDDAWQVRAFAIRTMGRRNAPQRDTWLAEEIEPRVIRAALAHGYTIDPARLARGVEFLAKQNDLEDKMLAVELIAASGEPADESLRELGVETLRTIILRMDRASGGALSPRIALVTGSPDLRRHYRWQHWLRRQGRSLELKPLRVHPDINKPQSPSLIAQLEPERFAAMETYMAELATRHVDLAICLDCTASMSGEIAAAQGGVDDLMLFVGDVCASVRFGLVAYRDRRDRDFETAAADFTADINEARRRLWQLSADGGGDTPEMVYEAMRAAYTQLAWDAAHEKALVIIGDAPPHIGTSGLCAQLATRGAQVGIITHAVQCKSRPVKHFDEIAAAGQGRCVTLATQEGSPNRDEERLGGVDALVPNIAGLALGERFIDEMTEFFRVYLELCR